MKVRVELVILLLLAVIGAVYYAVVYVPRHAAPGQPVFVLPKYILTYMPIRVADEPAYVLPESLTVLDSPSIIHRSITALKNGQQVDVIGRFRQWARIRTADGKTGWVEQTGLMNAETHAVAETLLSKVEQMPQQAAGHTSARVNLHVGPSRAEALIADLPANQPVSIYGRRLVERPPENPQPDQKPAARGVKDAWYLVRAGSHAGWMLGHLVDLDIPPAMAAYAANANLVAWAVINTVSDRNRQVPQYLVADREGSEEFDFTHIRVLTWWARKQTYAVAFVRGGFQGYFPIQVERAGSVPHFRLRVVDDEGQRVQQVYGLFDTMTRELGTVEGWETDAMPQPASHRAREKRGARRDHRP